MLHLVTFGGLALESVNEAVAPRLSAQRLAILAVLAAEGDRRVSRERLTGLFWPDADEEHARHSLRQAMYTLRHEMGHDVVRSDFLLRLDGSAITADVAVFRAALARGDRVAAGTLIRGPFLHGFYLPSAAPFQRWVEEERSRLHSAATTAITALATEASAASDLDSAIAWWRRLTELDPLSGRFAFGYLNALATRGDRAEALAFARGHEAIMRRELETEPDPEIRRLEARLRSSPTAPVVRSATSLDIIRPELGDGPSTVSPGADRVAAVVTPRKNRRRNLTRYGVALGLVVASAGVAWVAGWPSARSRATTTAVLPADVGTRSATAYRLYEEGLRSYYAADLSAARRLMRAALADDSTFAMAAYYNAILTDDGQNWPLTTWALELAARAPDRPRLFITTDLRSRLQSPDAIVVAESLGARYPADVRALETIARTRLDVGDWGEAAAALERAIAIDSSAGDGRGPCHLCDDLVMLAGVYFWWDSLPAAERVGRRYVRLHPESYRGWDILTWRAVKMGDSAAAAPAHRRAIELYPAARNAPQEVRYKLLLDQYETTLEDLRPLLESPRLDDVHSARWWLLISLRNQGRLQTAQTFNETGRLPGITLQVSSLVPEDVNQAVLAFERGDASAAATTLMGHRQRVDRSWPPGFVARTFAWNGTLTGMALAATGDTAAVLRLADTVEYWGVRSLYGRDRKLHHYLRGMVHSAAGRDDDAIREFRAAIHSYTLGFTRVNYELGRALVRRKRAREAVAVVAPALRGEIDASNLYITRTELHELLAQAYDMAGETDSAAVHYRAVVRAWANGDPEFHARRDSARTWLAHYTRR